MDSLLHLDCRHIYQTPHALLYAQLDIMEEPIILAKVAMILAKVVLYQVLIVLIVQQIILEK